MKQLNNDKSSDKSLSKCPSVDLLINYATNKEKDLTINNHVCNCGQCQTMVEQIRTRVRGGFLNEQDFFNKLKAGEDDLLMALNNQDYSSYFAAKSGIDASKSKQIITDINRTDYGEKNAGHTNKQTKEVSFFSYKTWTGLIAAAFTLAVIGASAYLAFIKDSGAESDRITDVVENRVNDSVIQSPIEISEHPVKYASVINFEVDKKDLIFISEYFRDHIDRILGLDEDVDIDLQAQLYESFLLEVDSVILGQKPIDKLDQKKLEQCVGKIPNLYKALSTMAKAEMMNGEQENPFILKIVKISDKQVVYQDTINHPPFALFSSSNDVLKDEWGNLEKYNIDYKLLKAY